MSVSELFSLCMNRRASFSGVCCYEISFFNCKLSMNLVKLCPCVREFLPLVFWWHKDTKTGALRAVSYFNCAMSAGKNKYIFAHYHKHTWGVLLILSSPSYEAVESFPCFLPFVHHFLRTKLFYRNMVRDLHSTLIFFSERLFFFCPFSETEDSERPYSPHEPEEETNEIERQRSKAQDATVQSRPRAHQPSASTGTDSDKNEVISTQQMCKEFTWFASGQQNWII